MKKIFVATIIVFLLLGISSVYATQPIDTATNELVGTQSSSIVKIKTDAEKELKDYEDIYGSKAYGYTAYILNKIRILSIPLCFLGIAVGSIYQYVIGIRKLDIRDRGFVLIISFVTILVICQILPLIFAIVVQGWRG